MMLRITFYLVLCSLLIQCTANARDFPNIILIMTDDQGIGDFSVHGNPFLETPHIDRLSTESTCLENFYVHPVCTPTRACLMTGRYNYRTRAIDTYIGRAMMEPEEVTIAEILGQAGYRTGIFGKWHLGDCYPMRAIDQGFQTAVIHRGGGIGQPSDPLDARRKYTDPILFRNGVPEAFTGYCTDIYYQEAIDFIRGSHAAKQPFFVYLPDNTPHGPFGDVPNDLYEYYLKKDIDRTAWGTKNAKQDFQPKDVDFLARVFAMIGNVDRNIGKLLNALESMAIADNTIVIFMCDNGPNSNRYTMGYRGSKASVYEGGIRSPFWIRWPSQIPSGNSHADVSAHIDILPTLLGLAKIPPPETLKLDGVDLSSLLRGERNSSVDRNLFIQSHRGNQPSEYHHMAVRNAKWKLVHPSGFGREGFEGQPKFELYNMLTDPKEKNNVAGQYPNVVNRLKNSYQAWFSEVSSTRPDNYVPPRIVIDGRKENPVTLTRQDWRRTSNQGWGNRGYWRLRLEAPQTLNFQCRLPDNRPADEITLFINDQPIKTIPTHSDRLSGSFEQVDLSPGDYRVSATSTVDKKSEDVFQIEIDSKPPPAP